MSLCFTGIIVMADLLETGEQLLENNLLSGNNSVDVFGDESKEDKELFGGDNDREWLENDEMGHTKVSTIRAFLSRLHVHRIP